MKIVQINIEFCEHYSGLPVPSYQTSGSAGIDLFAACNDQMIVKPGKIALVPTGIKIELPSGYEAQIRPRSGLALNHGITVLNSPGTVDADYRGEIKVILVNLGEHEFIVTRGARIAQMVIAEVVTAKLEQVTNLSGTNRGSGGFGHTGQ